MSLKLSFEEQVLTAHDWIAKTQEPQPVKIVQDDYDNGLQKIYLTFSDGSRKYQNRNWSSPEAHDEYYVLRENPETTEQDILEFINTHSELVDEEDLPNDPEAIGTEAEDAKIVNVQLEEITVLSMELRHGLAQEFNRALAGFSVLGDRFRQYLAGRQTRKELDFDPKALHTFAAKLQLRPHAELIDMRFYTPPGLRTSYVELFKTLQDCQAFAETTLNDTIIPLKQWAAAAYNEPERLRSVRTSFPVKVVDPTKLSKQLGAQCSFTGKAERSYGDCFERAGDWDELLGQVDDLFVRYQTTMLSRFDAETKALASAFGLLSQRLSCMDDSKVSSEIAQSLAEYVYKVARQVEFYSVYVTVLRTSFSALDQARDYWTKHIIR